MIKITYSFKNDELKKLDKNNMRIEDFHAEITDAFKKGMLDAERRHHEAKLKIEKQYTEEMVEASKEFGFYWNKKEKTTMNDMTKMIFEKLGVEPNEKFKIEGRNDIYYISENLNLWHDKSKTVTGSITDFILGTDKIIKLPKEKTFIELMNWKPKLNEKYHYVDSCNHVKTNKNECWVIDEQIIEHNKPYPTREMAERRKDIKGEYIKLGHTFTIQEWQDKNTEKWTLVINHDDKQVIIVGSYSFGYSKYEFTSKELGKQFIEFLGSTEQERYEAACLYL